MANKILLTGAGFSANFGAPLAEKMSDLFFNNQKIQNTNKLRELLQEKFDYENIYQIVMQSKKYSESEKKILNEAVQEAYKIVDTRIINNVSSGQTIHDLFKKLIFHFAKPFGGSGMVFTLNQDLFIERRFAYYPDSRISSLVLPIMGSSVLNQDWMPLSDNNRRFLPIGQDFDTEKQAYIKRNQKDKSLISYIKLHGSQEWFKSGNEPIMVIGTGKYEQIENERILSWYLDLFIEQLNINYTKLLVIGYGFNDEHINNAIANANRLSLYIIDIVRRSEFFTGLDTKPNGKNIKSLIQKYWPVTLKELFPNDVTVNPHQYWNEIKTVFCNG